MLAFPALLARSLRVAAACLGLMKPLNRASWLRGLRWSETVGKMMEDAGPDESSGRLERISGRTSSGCDKLAMIVLPRKGHCCC